MDADVISRPDALRKMTRHLADPTVVRMVNTLAITIDKSPTIAKSIRARAASGLLVIQAVEALINGIADLLGLGEDGGVGSCSLTAVDRVHRSYPC